MAGTRKLNGFMKLMGKYRKMYPVPKYPFGKAAKEASKEWKKMKKGTKKMMGGTYEEDQDPKTDDEEHQDLDTYNEEYQDQNTDYPQLQDQNTDNKELQDPDTDYQQLQDQKPDDEQLKDPIPDNTEVPYNGKYYRILNHKQDNKGTFIYQLYFGRDNDTNKSPSVDTEDKVIEVKLIDGILVNANDNTNAGVFSGMLDSFRNKDAAGGARRKRRSVKKHHKKGGRKSAKRHHKKNKK